jgi:hypothetical protein
MMDQISLRANPLLCGCDTLVFTARVGEGVAPVRWAALRFSSNRTTLTSRDLQRLGRV